MSCASCGKNKRGNGYIEPKSLLTPPFGSTDIQVYDSKTKEVRRFNASDWSEMKHKLLLFFPETFTPVCKSEMGALNKWIDEFQELDCDVFAITADPIHAVKDWYENEEELKDSQYKILSSYILPARLGILNNGKVKRANVFISKQGDVVVQEYPLKVGRSISELHRMVFAYSTNSYCAEGWRDPGDGFLQTE